MRLFRVSACLLAAMGLLSCSSIDINVPALNAKGEGQALPGKFVWHELLSDTPAQTEAFYSGLFGWEFESFRDKRLNYMMIRHQGRLIGGMIDQTRLQTKADISQWVGLLAVADIELAVAAVRDGGGTVFTPPTSLGDRGDIAVVADAQGALFALLESPSGEIPDSDELPPAGDFLWDELWTSDVSSAAEFYRQLAPYKAQQEALASDDVAVQYLLLRSQGQPRAGIRDNPVEGLPPIWVNYLRVSDVAALELILSKVKALGGEILLPLVARPRGGSMAIIAGPSGAGIALQTWENDRELAQTGEES